MDFFSLSEATIRRSRFQKGKKDTKENFTPNKDEGGTVESCPYAVPYKIGVCFSFHPILFNKKEYLEKESEFRVLNEELFPTNHLLADHRSQAVIEVSLVKLDENGKVTGDDIELATTTDHLDEGFLELELESDDFGVLSCKETHGRCVQIPLRDLPTGKTNRDKDSLESVVFVTSGTIGETNLKGRIVGECAFEYVPDFELPKNSKKYTSLKLGSREITEDIEGYDVMKYQWHLRKFGFKSYKFNDRVRSNGSGNRWQSLGDIVLDGDFGAKSNRASQDFQIVARGAFRNQTTTSVSKTYSSAISQAVNDSVLDEIEVWRDNKYTVECYHGLANINYDDGGVTINENGDIIYGAIVVDNEPQGYVEVQAPIGRSRCHYGNSVFLFADSIRTAIRLFRNDDLIFRLHDADSDDQLSNEHLNPGLKDAVIEMIRASRRDQEADYAGTGNRDLRFGPERDYPGFRTFAEQDEHHAKGRTAPGNIITNAVGGRSWHNYGVAADIVFCDENGDPS